MSCTRCKVPIVPLHITLNLLDTAQFNLGYRLSWQGMKHMCATLLTTVLFHRTGLPIDTRIGGLQPVYSQHNVMVQLWQNSAINSAMQRLTVPKAYNQRYTTRQQHFHLTYISKRNLHVTPWLHP